MEGPARIAFNPTGWRRPTGEAADLEQKGSYSNLDGSGYEEWLSRGEAVPEGTFADEND